MATARSMRATTTTADDLGDSQLLLHHNELLLRLHQHKTHPPVNAGSDLTPTPWVETGDCVHFDVVYVYGATVNLYF